MLFLSAIFINLKMTRRIYFFISLTEKDYPFHKVRAFHFVPPVIYMITFYHGIQKKGISKILFFL